MFFTTQTSGPTPLRSRLGTIIYVGIAGTERIEGAITNVDATYTAATPGIAKPDQLDVSIRILNQGNAHIVPEGKVRLRNTAGHILATMTLQPGWGLLPHEEDAYHVMGHGIPLKPGRYLLELNLLFGSDVRRPTAIRKLFEAVVTEDEKFRLLDTTFLAP